MHRRTWGAVGVPRLLFGGPDGRRPPRAEPRRLRRRLVRGTERTSDQHAHCVGPPRGVAPSLPHAEGLHDHRRLRAVGLGQGAQQSRSGGCRRLPDPRGRILHGGIGERRAAGLGAVAAVGFAALQSGGIGASHWSDLLLFASVILCGLGYAEGGLLARELGAWQTICWALVVAFPVMAALAGLSIAQQPPAPTLAGGAAFAYLSVVSMLLGFFAWYRGLGIGPMAQVSQVQLAQPILSLIWAALLLGEQLTWLTLLGAAAVIACALSAVRVRSKG
ncbi:MAG: hypothetical protein DI634_06335 [Kocuria palustris]|nr:MAG: hypothetical protein DI634_06335 [Kocuria palustris]